MSSFLIGVFVASILRLIYYSLNMSAACIGITCTIYSLDMPICVWVILDDYIYIYIQYYPHTLLVLYATIYDDAFSCGKHLDLQLDV